MVAAAGFWHLATGIFLATDSQIVFCYWLLASGHWHFFNHRFTDYFLLLAPGIWPLAFF
jgi:hypothetical protein